MNNYKIGDRVSPPYFHGVYPEGLGKAAFDDPFNSAGYQAHCRAQANFLGMFRSGFLTKGSRFARIEKALFYMHRPKLALRHLLAGGACPAYLMPVAQMIRDAVMRNGRARVLDIGGGYGDNFFHLLQILPHAVVAALEYVIVDNHRVCELGESLFKRYEVKPRFGADAFGADITLLIGTLQYIDGWRDFLRNRKTEHLYIARTPIALSAASFTTTQLICPGGRYLGPTRINVVGLKDLRDVLGKPSFELMAEDYSRQFACLPSPQNDVRYFHTAWSR